MIAGCTIGLNPIIYKRIGYEFSPSMQGEAVVRWVMWLIKHPQTGVLVVSTSMEVLQLLEHALTVHHRVLMCMQPSLQVEAVVRRVMWLTKNPQTNVLVFSTWVEVLRLLEHALNTNHVPCVFAKNRKALEQAIEDIRKPVGSGQPHLQTMLLQLKQGGNGLNLTGHLIDGAYALDCPCTSPMQCRCV